MILELFGFDLLVHMPNTIKLMQKQFKHKDYENHQNAVGI